ncbi:hypothetical protein B0O80DRAFT_205300 [Mortierella sp. GBAus27b]|nr:ATPase AAA domain-containing protein 2B [Mortierella sp. GBA43]KAI8360501.1 hypothetical protein B0O80DRAFT_205300 [Mortierella sp. GBAus27b]
MDHDPQVDTSTPSTTNDSFTLKRGITSDDDEDARQDYDPHLGKTQSVQLNHNYSDSDMNETKRRRIQGEEDILALSATNLSGTSGSVDQTNSSAIFPPSLSSRPIRATRETSIATTVNITRTQTRPGEDSRSISLELRQRIKDDQDTISEFEQDEEEDDDEDEDEDEDINDLPPERTRSRSIRNQSRPSQPHTASEDDEFKAEHDKDETKSDLFGPRMLRDRRSIVAPKPFPDGNPPVSRQSSRSRRHTGSRQNGGRYDESSKLYRSSSRLVPQKRPPPVVRQITENMRITRGMVSSLQPDSSNSRDVTPDRPTRGNGTLNSRYHRSIYSDEEQDLDDHEGQHDEGEEEDDEEMEGAVDDDQTGSMNNQDDSGSIRMTRLRARIQSQASTNTRHLPQRSSRLNPTHPQSQQDADRKYDLRERPKNKPAYISDRPLPSPPRPRSSRLSSFNPFSRSRHGRSSLLEALARAGASSSDEHEAPSFKRRSGGSESRNTSSRILPMNMHELTESRRDVIAARAVHLADTDPLSVGKSVDFSKVGGLDHHIKSLKEMVILPLLYPEVYTQFQITPPRGVLFHGPPGTGKTLLARALASSCSTETQKVAFFMRKGADCLSKWVGEAERQLRLLFEEAKAWQPSIIFFDEIDGLCPVRSSKQEQIHSSIVSTMLALMDGLDGRGQVIVIGATNRIDAIDPALRRPGRFDREFYFPLPNEAARRAIIDINTSGWVPALDERFKDELARITTRYCGADIKALCTEAALRAIRRRYPQIYDSNEKLQINASTIVVDERDLLKAAQALTPASYRVTGATASALPSALKPLLEEQFDLICKAVDALFPGASRRSSKASTNDDDDTSFQAMGYRNLEKLRTFRPRMIITGQRGMGQRYIGPALLHYLEGCMIQQFDLAALMSESNRTPEAACVQFFVEVKRHSPSIIYIPHIDVWWSIMSDAVKATFSNLLDDLNPEDGILFLATSETPLSDLPITIKRWFISNVKGRVALSRPTAQDRRTFFEKLVEDISRPPTDFKVKPMDPTQLQPLKKAPPPQPRVPTAEEKKLLVEHDQYVLRELRISLRTIIDELYKERRFKPFYRTVEHEEAVDYYQTVKKPMDLATISEKINDRMYVEVKEFLADIDLIVDNAILYYHNQDPNRIIHRARDAQDLAHAMVGRLDPELISETEKTAARLRQEVKAQQRPQGERVSRRRLGLEAPAVLENPEILLRNRTMMNKLATDSAHEDNMETAVKLEGQEQSQDLEGPSQSQDPGLNQTQNDHETHRDKIRVNDEDAEDSGSSLSLVSSRAGSSVASVTERAFDLSPPPLNGQMDVDSPRISPMIIGSSMLNDSAEAEMTMQAEEDSSTIKPSESNTPIANTDGLASTDATQHKYEIQDLAGDMDTLTDKEQEPKEPMIVPEEVEEEPKEMLLDQDEVALLQEALVNDTADSSVEELDQLRASLYANIWEHRLDWDKGALLSDMKTTLASVTDLHREYRASEKSALESFLETLT